MEPMKTFSFRSLPQWLEQKPRVDRKNAIMYGVVAMQIGEAMGHGVWADQKTLQAMVDLGNSKPKGVAGRYGHPGMSENTMGKKVQVAKNFRIEGDRVVHDAHMWQPARLSPSFPQDPIEYLMNVAETDPEGIGESVVVHTELAWVLQDGREIHVDEEYSPEDVKWEKGRPVNASTPLPSMRPVKFHFVDFVSEGALTPNGLFSTNGMFDGHSSEYAHELFDVVDKWRAAYNVPLAALPEKIDDMLERYIATREDHRMARKTQLAAHPVVVPVHEDVEDTELESLDELEEIEEFDTEEEVTETAPEAPANPDLLAEAEALASDLGEQEGFEELFAQFATVAEVKALGENVARFTAELERVKELLIRNLQATATLNRNLKRIDGEPVVSLQVPSTPEKPFEMQFSHPDPTGARIPDPATLNKNEQRPISAHQAAAIRNQGRKKFLQRSA